MKRRGISQARHNDGSLPGWAWLLIGALSALALVMIAPKYLQSERTEDGFFRPQPNPETRPVISALDGAGPPKTSPAERALPGSLHEPDYDFYTILPRQKIGNYDSGSSMHAETSSVREQEPTTIPASTEAAREQTSASRAVAATHPDAAALATAKPKPKPKPALTPKPTLTSASVSASRPTSASTPKPKPKPILAPTKPNHAVASAEETAPSHYLLQVGEFGDPAEAESLKAQIALLGFRAQVEAVTADDKPVHHVRLGPYASANELSRIKQRLDDGGIVALAIHIE